jgi:hypothetical protein
LVLGFIRFGCVSNFTAGSHFCLSCRYGGRYWVLLGLAAYPMFILLQTNKQFTYCNKMSSIRMELTGKERLLERI